MQTTKHHFLTTYFIVLLQLATLFGVWYSFYETSCFVLLLPIASAALLTRDNVRYQMLKKAHALSFVFKPTSRPYKLLTAPFIKTVILYGFYLFLSFTLFVQITFFSPMFWVYLLFHLLLTLTALRWIQQHPFSFFQEEVRQHSSKKLLSWLLSLLLFSVSLLFFYYGKTPALLHADLFSTQQQASHMYTSSCGVLDYTLRLVSELNALFQWGSTYLIQNNTLISEKYFLVSILFLNGMGAYILNRFIVELIDIMEVPQPIKVSLKDEKRTFSAAKLFWYTIYLFIGLTLILVSLAYLNTTIPPSTATDSFIKLDEKIIPKNLKVYEPELHELQNKSQKKMLDSINRNINLTYAYAINNLDNYLNWHYSVSGEYEQLGAAAMGNFAQKIEKKLLGSDFNRRLNTSLQTISSDYNNLLQDYTKDVTQRVLTGVDLTLNPQIPLHIETFATAQIGKITVIGALASTKIIAKLSTKIAGKSIAKLMAKGGAKLSTKLATASTSATLGLACGPYVVVCAPVLATAAWFGTDAAVVTADEYLHRRAFKGELIVMLMQDKRRLQGQLTEKYLKAFMTYDQMLKTQLPKIRVKTTIRETWQEHN